MSGRQREMGRRALLTEVRRSGRVPRIDLSERTGISRATVTTITADLIREGLIEEISSEVPEKDARRGRPRVDLRIRGEAHMIAGAKITDKTIRLVLLDFAGNQLADHEVDLERAVFSVEELCRLLTPATEELAAKVGRGLADISGIGIGIAGIVDAPRGFVYWSPSLGERNVELGKVLQSHLGIRVYVENDANLVALAEQYFGMGKSISDFIVVTIESGVGMGIVIGNELYRGTRGCGAEFGHTKVQLEGATCRCGQSGCLEAYVADYALIRQASEADEELANKPVEDILTAARQGNKAARKIVKQAGQMFAMGLANIVNVFDPEVIILAGEQMRFDHLYAEEVIQMMRRQIVQIDKAPPEVRVHEWGDLMWARGGAAYALDKISELAARGVTINAA